MKKKIRALLCKLGKHGGWIKVQQGAPPKKFRYCGYCYKDFEGWKR
jgi:hypothetical protein